MKYSIDFNRPYIAGNESEYIAEAIRIGQISGNGHFTRLCESLLEEALGVPRVLLTTSCTAALEMTGLLLDLEPPHEVILPSFTFVSTANAFVLRRARPVFVDIRRDTLNLDESKIEAKLSEHTRAIVPVHYGGVACEMDRICEIASSVGARVIEDNAHGLFARYKGRPLGSIGDLATQSFHETKNLSCGEGGALVIRDPDLCARAEIIREKGTDRSRYLRGEVQKYSWVDVGSSFELADLLAAFLYAQFEQRDRIQQARKRIWQRYASSLAEWAGRYEIGLPHVPIHCEQSHHLFYLLLPSEPDRDSFIDHLKSKGILAVFHYQPLHLSAMGRRMGYVPGDCPVTEDVSQRLVRLPFYNGLSEADQGLVIEAVLEFRPASRKG